MITLKKVDTKNLWKIVRLKVREDQQDFVASNAESIMEAWPQKPFTTASAFRRTARRTGRKLRRFCL